MYDVLPSFILGFHGCDQQVAEGVFAGQQTLRPSHNEYDWLGHGVYFWENNPERAGDYAQHLRDKPRRTGAKVKQPAVVGAVVDLGRCLNLLDHRMIRLVKDAHAELLETLAEAGRAPPDNSGGADLTRRFLDCAVLVYPKAGFYEKSHIQVCVRNLRCIKGYFRVLPEVVV